MSEPGEKPRVEALVHLPSTSLAATRMVFGCPRCKLRFPPATACPACGGDSRDLRHTQSRRSLLTTLYSEAQRPPRWLTLSQRRPVAVSLVVTTVGVSTLVLCGVGLYTALAVVLVVLMLGFPINLILTGISNVIGLEGRALRAGGPQLALAPPAPATGGRARRVRGRAHVRTPLTSPLGGAPCAVWRLVGEGPSGPIDDAAVSELDVMSEGRVVGRVTAEDAIVDLPTPAPSAVTVEAHSPLAEFLHDRGALPTGAHCELAEALIVEGDEVEVGSGRPTPGPRPTASATPSRRGCSGAGR